MTGVHRLELFFETNLYLKVGKSEALVLKLKITETEQQYSE